MYLLKKKDDVMKVKNKDGSSCQRQKDIDEVYFRCSQIKLIIGKHKSEDIFRRDT